MRSSSKITGEAYRNHENRNLLKGVAATGRKDIRLGCCGGGCGICKVDIASGIYCKRVLNRGHVNEQDEANHRVRADEWPAAEGSGKNETECLP